MIDLKSGGVAGKMHQSCIHAGQAKNVTIMGYGTQDGPAGHPAMMEGCPEMQRRGFFPHNAVNVDLRGVKIHGVQDEWLDIDESVQLEA
ncbi:MAG: hypothetical protein IKK21_08035 [Clostridia bacterium]|nr:hypothetical protein [Clostridia bacterium]